MPCTGIGHSPNLNMETQPAQSGDGGRYALSRMAPPKRNSRRITVGDRIYRWYYHVDEEDYREPPLATVSVLAEDNLNGAGVSASARYDGSITPSVVRCVIESALKNDWDPDADKTTSTHLNEFQSNCCFRNFPRLLTHHDSEFLCTLVEKGGLHMKIRSTAHPRTQELVTYCTLDFADCNQKLATAFIDSALGLGWQPNRRSRDAFWLQQEHCTKVISSCRRSPQHDQTA